MRRGDRVPTILAASVAVAIGLGGITGLPHASAAPPSPGDNPPPALDDTRAPNSDLTKQPRIRLDAGEQDQFRSSAPRTRPQRSSEPPAATGTPIGGQKPWLVLDDSEGTFSPDDYTLRAVGDKAEIWVQSDINFPAGDCRNDGVRNVITDDQVSEMVTAFDKTILPKESEVFSIAPERDGSKQIDVGFGAPMWKLLGDGDPNFYVGDADKTVVLVSNVRDDNFYEPTTPSGSTFVSGFFAPIYNEAFDRNIVTLDSYDWLHRTGANPPNEEDGGLCSSSQIGRPRAYEGTLAHEYQHLLAYYAKPGQKIWMKEGLANYAQTVTGFVDTTIPYGQTGGDRQIGCYQGFAATEDFPYCGAENSISRWEDQENEPLADYGAAYAFISYLADRYGPKIISDLHRNGSATGLAAVQNWLDANDRGTQAKETLADFLAQMALDRKIDEGAHGLDESEQKRFSAKNLSSAIDWDFAGSYDSPGAPTNGADFIKVRSPRPLDIEFNGAKTFPAKPLEWRTGNDMLYSGEGDTLDRRAIVSATVPHDDAALTFESKTEIETGWDFGVVQVSTDSGETWKTLPGDATTSQTADGVDPKIAAELPGLTGTADWAERRYDLSEYAGKEVLISWRYLTDAAANGNGNSPTGWWVRGAAVGETELDLTSARSATQVRPVPVAGWSVQLVSWDDDGDRVGHQTVDVVDAKAKVAATTIRRELGGARNIGVIVMAADPDEASDQYADYQLKIGGVVQPGGSKAAPGGDSAASDQQQPNR